MPAQGGPPAATECCPAGSGAQAEGLNQGWEGWTCARSNAIVRAVGRQIGPAAQNTVWAVGVQRAMSIGTRLFTLLHGEFVGADEFGNRYYREKGGVRRHVGGLDRERRWVMYSGEPEGSKVPAEWNAWLHHTSDAVPAGSTQKRAWLKPHVQNLTGTPYAYRPRGHEFRGGRRASATGDYEPWRPE